MPCCVFKNTDQKVPIAITVILELSPIPHQRINNGTRPIMGMERINPKITATALSNL